MQELETGTCIFFVHDTCPASVLKRIIETTISKLNNIGLNVRGIVNDMGSSNNGVATALNISEDRRVFSVDGKEIIYLFDVPHLIKAIRNMLKKKINLSLMGKQQH
jgi:hypothetical protein